MTGGTPLHGSIAIQGSKNAALPLLAGTVLHQGKTVLYNVPAIRDIDAMIQILQKMGCSIKREQNCLEIDASSLETPRVDAALGGQMRSSIMLLGALAGRCGGACLPFPGGCVIGARPIDLHKKALEKMGAVFVEKDGMLCVEAGNLHGAEICLAFPSVGATENVILAAALAEGATVIRNCAKEPEIVELCLFLKQKGAKISGEGTSCIAIEGVKNLEDSSYTLMSDRIVAGTYLMAAAATRGEILLKGAEPAYLKAVLDILQKMGAEFRYKEEGLWMDGRRAVHPAAEICTAPYPGFPTDLQSQLLAVLCLAEGKSVIQEAMFEERFRIAAYLNQMGACVTADGTKAVVKGKRCLWGNEVKAEELRGGAALVIAGLAAKGTTRVYGRRFIERGYEDLAGDLRKLGADIR